MDGGEVTQRTGPIKATVCNGCVHFRWLYRHTGIAEFCCWEVKTSQFRRISGGDITALVETPDWCQEWKRLPFGAPTAGGDEEPDPIV